MLYTHDSVQPSASCWWRCTEPDKLGQRECTIAVSAQLAFCNVSDLAAGMGLGMGSAAGGDALNLAGLLNVSGAIC
jgi:hypothetical protein